MFMARGKVLKLLIIRIQISFSKLQLTTMSDSSWLSSEASLCSSDSLDSFSNFGKLKPYRSNHLEVIVGKRFHNPPFLGQPPPPPPFLRFPPF